MARQMLFKNAADPAALAAKLTTSPFFKRNAGVAQVEGSDVRCVFEQGVAKQKILQACSENFKKWGAKDIALGYGQHVVDDTPSSAPAASAAAPAPAAAPAASSAARDRSRSPRMQSSALAVRTSVAGIWSMAAPAADAARLIRQQKNHQPQRHHTPVSAERPDADARPALTTKV